MKKVGIVSNDEVLIKFDGEKRGLKGEDEKKIDDRMIMLICEFDRIVGDLKDRIEDNGIGIRKFIGMMK